MTTATVEVLTAEVRTLQVAARQITLSVARQLDVMDPFCWPTDAFEPFGRVRTGTKVTHDVLRSRWPSTREQDSGRWCRGDNGEWYEEVPGFDPYCEFIGKRREDGALVIYRVDRTRDIEDEDDRRQIAEWKRTLPLIVLAGLR